MKIWRPVEKIFRKSAFKKLKTSSLPVNPNNKVYIFFSFLGMSYLLTFSLMLLISINYSNNIAIAGICFLIVLQITSILKNYFSLRKITIKEISQQPGFENQKIITNIVFQFKKNKNNIYQSVELKIGPDKFLIQPNENGEAVCTWVFTQKAPGVFEFPIIELSTSWPLGMSRSWTYIKINKSLAIIPLPDKASSLENRKIIDEKTTHQSLSGEISGIRPVHKYEKDVRISWKHSIKHNQQITYTWERGSEEVMLIKWPSSKQSNILKLKWVSKMVQKALDKSISFQITHPTFKSMQGKGMDFAYRVLHSLTLHTISPEKLQIEDGGVE